VELARKNLIVEKKPTTSSTGLIIEIIAILVKLRKELSYVEG
jgi:hypothetical protein